MTQVNAGRRSPGQSILAGSRAAKCKPWAILNLITICLSSGAGSGGVRAARTAGSLGARVAIAEDRYLGGTCVNVGCIPKKLFVYAAQYAEDFRDAAGYGWQVPGPAFDWKVLLQNKNHEIKRLNDIYESMLKQNNVVTYQGRAVITGPNTVRVNAGSVSARRILVATGGWPHIPDVPGREYVISSNEAFYLETLPGRAVIVGGGYIAVEFAGIFHGLGVDTTLVYRGGLFLRGFDEELRLFLAGQMRRKGIKLLFNTRVDSIERRERRYRVNLPGTESITTDLVLYATGRRPNTADLGLEAAGVRLNEKGAIVVDDEYCSSVASIYAIGDVTDRMNLTPVATAEGTALAHNLYNKQSRRVDYRNIPTCIFSQPSLGTVGLTEEQARQQYANVEVYSSRFTA